MKIDNKNDIYKYTPDEIYDYIYELQNKIDKSIEIIESYNLGKYDYSIPPIGIIDLLEILKDSDVDE